MAELLNNLAKRWTYEDYSKLDDDKRYEIIDGTLIMAPSPTDQHQDWASELHLLLAPFVKNRQIGRLFIAPFDVVLDDENTVQPDLVFVLSSKAGIIRSRGIFGAPDLLIEIVSPSSVRKDRYEKKALYARFGVREFWLADPGNHAIEVLTLESGSYKLHCSAEEKGPVNSTVLSGFSFDISQLPPPR